MELSMDYANKGNTQVRLEPTTYTPSMEPTTMLILISDEARTCGHGVS